MIRQQEEKRQQALERQQRKKAAEASALASGTPASSLIGDGVSDVAAASMPASSSSPLSASQTAAPLSLNHAASEELDDSTTTRSHTPPPSPSPPASVVTTTPATVASALLPSRGRPQSAAGPKSIRSVTSNDTPTTEEDDSGSVTQSDSHMTSGSALPEEEPLRVKLHDPLGSPLGVGGVRSARVAVSTPAVTGILTSSLQARDRVFPPPVRTLLSSQPRRAVQLLEPAVTDPSLTDFFPAPAAVTANE